MPSQEGSAELVRGRCKREANRVGRVRGGTAAGAGGGQVTLEMAER